MNDDTLCEWDVLIKMAVIHHQFESIILFMMATDVQVGLLTFYIWLKKGF